MVHDSLNKLEDHKRSRERRILMTAGSIKIQKIRIPYGVLFVQIVFLLWCCATLNPTQISLLPSMPDQNTFASSFPEIASVYESDREICLFAAWGNNPPSGSHTLAWEIADGQGLSVYSTKKENITIRSNSSISYRLALDKGIKDKLNDGAYKVTLLLDDKPVLSKEIRYESKSILNGKIPKAVVLPFKDNSVWANMPSFAIDAALNTIADIFYLEVKRSIPDTVPYYIAERTMGRAFSQDCFNDANCIQLLENSFGRENIYITGQMTLAEYVGESCTLSVTVYNSKTGETKRYNGSSGTQRYSDSIREMCREILYMKGFLNDLRGGTS